MRCFFTVGADGQRPRPLRPECRSIVSDHRRPARRAMCASRTPARQPVTAWSLAATTPTANGGTHREVYTTDGYLSEATHGLPKAAERLERLMPGESRELPLDPLPAGAKVDVLAAVMDDGTAMGDEATIASIFANRVKERDALKAVVDTFNAVLPAKHGAEALSALKERFTALVATARQRAVPRRARRGAGLRTKRPKRR